MEDYDSMAAGLLLQKYRDSLMKLAGERDNKVLMRECDRMEESISKRMAW